MSDNEPEEAPVATTGLEDMDADDADGAGRAATGLSDDEAENNAPGFNDGGESSASANARAESAGASASAPVPAERRGVRLVLDVPDVPPPLFEDEREQVPGQFFYVALPKFLNIERQPFDEDTYADEDGATEEQVLNTIRWRNEGPMKKLSNTRLVRWSDGTLGLFVGRYYYDVNEHPVDRMHWGTQLISATATVQATAADGPSAPTVVAVEQDYGEIKQRLTFQPTGASAAVLKKAYHPQRAAARNTLEIISTKEDPIVEQERLAQAEREIERNRKRIDSGRRAHQDRLNAALTAESLNAGADRDSDEEAEDDADGAAATPRSAAKRVRRAAPAKFVVPEAESGSESDEAPASAGRKKRAKRRSRAVDEDDDEESG
eukprot:Unigene14147_Nuclearia_a/m.42690 Unigene14147_Nuclearia_a/g.42690  ORF Unigene14147_Nuclearia_a/g.42690 Unigene14147_Nuclearia_a/m.42690 type:complete len:378 (+) Unigene14147_Nuclearia_a:2-1135(+)